MQALIILLAILVLMSAIGLFVAGVSSVRRRALLPVSAGAALFGVVLFIIGLSLVNVGANERMVIFNRVSGNLGESRGPGITVVNPLTTSYTIYDLSRQTYTMSRTLGEGEVYGSDAVEARTSGGQLVFVEVTVIYSINPDQINKIHQNWPNERYRDELIRPLLRSVVRDAVSEFTIEVIYQERATIDNTITEAVAIALENEGFLLQDVLVRDIAFTDEYTNAIERAQIAEVEIREEQFRVEAVQQQAAQRAAEAQGRADARRIEAEAEADALRFVAQVLEENPALLEYQYVQNLSDNIQVLALPANSPFIFDLQALMDQQIGTPAPGQ